MAIFKSPAEKMWELYNKLSDEEKAEVKLKLAEVKEEPKDAEHPEEKAEEVREAKEAVEDKIEDEHEEYPDDVAVQEHEAEKKVEDEIEDVRPDYDAKFREYDEMFAAMNAKIEGLVKKPIEDERKPFGKSEGNADYHAPAIKETSSEMLTRLFGK